jgi:dihydroorotate dehydrogenase electron transfer subunit
VHIKIDEKVTILRRPFSIHKISGNTIYVLFRVRGRGTRLLSQLGRGDVLDIIGPLGNGFAIRPKTKGQGPKTDTLNILVAGGMGVAPLVFLAQKLKQTTNYKLQTTVLLGAKNKNEVLAEQEFKKLGFDVHIATDDGSRGYKGTVVALLKKTIAMHSALCAMQAYACGPQEMFYEIAKIIKHYRNIACQVSFEQFIGCGLGICCGCSIETKQGYKKLCKDGPVFDIKELK